jgi:hypothetical protein
VRYVMEKKIIAVFVALVIVAILVVSFVLAAAGGVRRMGGFSDLFDDLAYSGNETYNQLLEIPSSWHVNDTKSVDDLIVDIRYDSFTDHGVTVYVTDLYFVYIGDKWASPQTGSVFRVPGQNGWIFIDHGLFSIRVSSATNLSEQYHPGDIIKLESKIVSDGVNGRTVAFGDWRVSDVV